MRTINQVLRAIYLRARTSYQLVQRNQLRNHKYAYALLTRGHA